MRNSARTIKGYTRYKVYRDGTVIEHRTKKVIIPKPQNKGYILVKLYDDALGIWMNRLLHKMLANTFIPNPDNLPCVDHIDRNKKNNSLDNLRHVTRKQNMRNTSRNTEESVRILETLDGMGIERSDSRYRVFHRRLKNGWSIERTLTTPIRGRKLE